MDGESEDTATVTSDAQRALSDQASCAGRVSILATSPNEEFFGCGIVDVREGVIEIPMPPTIRYEGHVLGCTGSATRWRNDRNDGEAG